MLFNIQLYLGAEHTEPQNIPNYGAAWKGAFSIEELILHHKYEMEVGDQGIRDDYDLVLLRLNYPVADPDTGMTRLKVRLFSGIINHYMHQHREQDFRPTL